MSWWKTIAMLVLAALCLCACRRDMGQQPYHRPLDASSVFADGMSARPLPEHTIARGQLHEDEQFFTGRLAGQPVNTFPAPVTQETLERGRERFEIYCAVCHGRTGEGNGMIVRRGFPAPTSFHVDRLREAPAGHFVEVITYGYGLMYPYASRVEPADRWAIAAYIRALQLSQHAALDDAPPAERVTLEQEAAP
jgi:mono/diheme cytochrome c family protein